ncbi:MAG: phenylacetate--CoA ligase family protein [Candidatus Hodarchaeota archaeon]
MPKDIKNLNDLKFIPFLNKDDVKNNANEMLSQEHQRKVEHCHSGGTLGKPLNFIRDSLSSAYVRAAELRGFGWHGITKGDKQARIWGLTLDPHKAKKERFNDFLLNRYRISPFNITDKTVHVYYDKLNKFKAKYIYGYPSAIYKICQIINKLNLHGRKLGIKYVVTTAETLYPHQRSLIENVLRCRVINEYGCSEVGVIAFECPEGNLHITMENVLVEFLHSEQSPDNNPEIILTNLNSFSMPFLRYKIGDTGKLSNHFCPCGRQSLLMNFDAGRVLDLLMTCDGSFVSGTVFCYICFDIIDKYKGIDDFRVVQKAKNKIEICLSKDENFNENILSMLSQKIKGLMGNEMEISYKIVDKIAPERSGKRRFVYSEIPID